MKKRRVGAVDDDEDEYMTDDETNVFHDTSIPRESNIVKPFPEHC